MNLRTRLTRRSAALLAGGGIIAMAVGGFAVAAIPNADGTITGCYSTSIKNKGDLRIIDAATTSCSFGEKTLTWNQQGQPGVPGPSGPAGPPGSAGPSGALTSRTFVVDTAADSTESIDFGPYRISALCRSVPPEIFGADFQDLVTINTLGSGDATIISTTLPTQFTEPGNVVSDGPVGFFPGSSSQFTVQLVQENSGKAITITAGRLRDSVDCTMVVTVSGNI